MINLPNVNIVEMEDQVHNVNISFYDCRVSVVFFDKPGYEIGTRGTTLQ